MLSKKFRGALLGNLIGDCMGEKFEYAEYPRFPNPKSVADFFEEVRQGKKEEGSLEYTDDTAMTIVLSNCFIHHKKVNHEYLAKKLMNLFFAERQRGYGMHVARVFQILKVGTVKDVLKPAREQFDGKGSFGNGAAMRATPVGLFFHNDEQQLIKEAHESSLVTHTHVNGYNGAILQALAVRLALLSDPEKPIDPVSFVQELKKHIATVEDQTDGPGPYMQKLEGMEELLAEENPTIKKVVDVLGNNVTAVKSVPTAIYSFLVAQKPIEGIETTNTFERTINYAINVGGDTDTIACMAGGICGAHLGEDAIPQYLIKACEKNEYIISLADQLFEALPN